MIQNIPKVSIICGYYNRADYVQDSIYSLLNQTFKNIEVIVFDDCSTDGTLAELEKIAQVDQRLIVIPHKQNKGFVRGIIEAVKTARGEYIAIHGSGDFSYETRIEKQVRVLDDEATIGLVGCYVENVESGTDGDKMSIWKHDIKGRCIDVLTEKNIFTHGEVMFRVSIYKESGGYRAFFKFTQDYDLWTRMAIHCDFYTIPEILYRRYLRTDGASVVPEKKLFQSLLGVVVKQNAVLIREGKPDLIDCYGDDAFDHIQSMSSQSTELLVSRMIDVYINDGNTSELLKKVIQILHNNASKRSVGILLKFVFQLPTKVGRYLVQNPLFKYFISVAIYKLP